MASEIKCPVCGLGPMETLLESGALFCRACDNASGRADAEKMERELRAALTKRLWLDNKVDHVWHVWINSESPMGKDEDKPTVMPINPHEDEFYSFKSMIGMVDWLGGRIEAERKQALPMVHQQCSHSAPEAMPENYLMCGLGQKIKECPILQRLRAKFAEQRAHPYYATITDDQVDRVQAATCLWHMYSQGFRGQFVDWNEGAVQDCSDRKFWNRVYENLASEPEEEPE